MSNIIEASQLPESEKVYLKKDWAGWRVVEPIRNEDGNINWKKFLLGSKRMWLQIIIYMVITLLLYFGIKELISQYQLIANNPCDYCVNCYKSIPINLSLKR